MTLDELIARLTHLRDSGRVSGTATALVDSDDGSGFRDVLGAWVDADGDVHL